jgi:Protein of unknown function (DUF2786)
MVSKLSDVIERVKKLLNVANNSDKSGEIAAAQALAQELMTKYQIEQAQLQGHKRDGDIVSVKVETLSPYIDYKATLLNYIAKNNFCRVLQGNEYCLVFGYDSDIKLTLAVYEMLSLHMVSEMKSKLKQYKKTSEEKVFPKNWAKSFFGGYCITIGERFKEAKSKVINDYESTNKSVALVVRDKEHAIEEFFQNLTGGKKRTRKFDANDGYEAGVTSARNANIGQTPIED